MMTVASVVVWILAAIGVAGAVVGASWLAVRGIPRRRHQADDEADEIYWT